MTRIVDDKPELTLICRACQRKIAFTREDVIEEDDPEDDFDIKGKIRSVRCPACDRRNIVAKREMFGEWK